MSEVRHSYIVSASREEDLPAQQGCRQRRRKLSPRTAIPFVLFAIFALQSFWFIRTQSLTYDEPAHIIAGVDAWRHGRFELWNDHPPLGRLWLTLAMMHLDSHYEWHQLPTGYRVEVMQPGPEDIAARTRPMNTLLGIALGAALWFAARRLFSEGAANVALALFAFTPSLIAHYSSPPPTASARSSSFSSLFNSSAGGTNPTGRRPCSWDSRSADCCWPSSTRLRWSSWHWR